MAEKVHHPPHYNQHPKGIECITVVEDFNFNLGNAIKYIWRVMWPKEGNDALTDLAKAKQYIEFEMKRRTP
jgi:hypothetical protein